MKSIILLFLCLAPAGLVLGQGYNTSANKVLNYQEVTRGSVEIIAPQGKFPVQTYHDADIDIHFTGNDSALASYDSLAISIQTPRGKNAPETSTVIGKPFVLYFPPNGRVKTVKTPEFPQSFKSVTDLRWEFWDFFLRLPSQPLRNGLTWTDTLFSNRYKSQIMQNVGHYKVTGDTVIDGVSAKIVTARLNESIEASGKGPGPGMTAQTKLSGIEHSEFYFSQEEGVLIGRKRVVTLNGELKYEGGPQPVTLPEHMKIRSTISLIQK